MLILTSRGVNSNFEAQWWTDTSICGGLQLTFEIENFILLSQSSDRPVNSLWCLLLIHKTPKLFFFYCNRPDAEQSTGLILGCVYSWTCFDTTPVVHRRHSITYLCETHFLLDLVLFSVHQRNSYLRSTVNCHAACRGTFRGTVTADLFTKTSVELPWTRISTHR